MVSPGQSALQFQCMSSHVPISTEYTTRNEFRRQPNSLLHAEDSRKQEDLGSLHLGTFQISPKEYSFVFHCPYQLRSKSTSINRYSCVIIIVFFFFLSSSFSLTVSLLQMCWTLNLGGRCYLLIDTALPLRRPTRTLSRSCLDSPTPTGVSLQRVAG